jgi:cell division initiation protein
MESTSGTPHLLTDVRFSVARKGYDPDEVDNFLERVSAAVAQLQEKLRQATANAEAAEGRATEATRAQTLLQARVDKLEADLATARAEVPAAAPVRSPEDDAAEVSKVLVLAQRTADAAVAEARATATQTLAEAEAEATRIVATARTEADESATRQREALTAEVRSLEDSRAKLSSDIAALTRSRKLSTSSGS